jgi:hypothetical protein
LGGIIETIDAKLASLNKVKAKASFTHVQQNESTFHIPACSLTEWSYYKSQASLSVLNCLETSELSKTETKVTAFSVTGVFQQETPICCLFEATYQSLFYVELIYL